MHSCRLASGRRVEELDFGPATVTADNGKRYVHVRPHGLDLYLKFVVQYETANGCLWARCEHCVQDREMGTFVGAKASSKKIRGYGLPSGSC